MATNKDKVIVTDTRTMQKTEFDNAEMALLSLEPPTIMPKLNVGGSSNYAKKIAGKIVERNTFTADKPSENNPFGYDAATLETKYNGDTSGAFSKKDTETGAKGADKTLDQVASEYAENKFTPTGVWEYDLGYALGRSRKKKIDAAGGKEAFKAAKQEKRSTRQIERKQSRAIAKERKSFKPMNKMSVIEPRSLPTRSKKHELFNKK